MKQFFSMPSWWRPKSDEEYARWIRRFVKMQKGMAAFNLAVALLCFGAAIGFGYSLLNIVAHPERLTFLELTPGIALGFLIGLMSGLFVFLGAIYVGVFLSFLLGFRTERLLLKYYDLASQQRTNG